MSLKSLLQAIIILTIIIILGSVYYNYFVKNSRISLEKNVQTEINTNKTEKKITLTKNPIEKKKNCY